VVGDKQSQHGDVPSIDRYISPSSIRAPCVLRHLWISLIRLGSPNERLCFCR